MRTLQSTGWIASATSASLPSTSVRSCDLSYKHDSPSHTHRQHYHHHRHPPTTSAVVAVTHETPFYPCLNAALRSTNRTEVKPFYYWLVTSLSLSHTHTYLRTHARTNRQTHAQPLRRHAYTLTTPSQAQTCIPALPPPQDEASALGALLFAARFRDCLSRRAPRSQGFVPERENFYQ